VRANGFEPVVVDAFSQLTDAVNSRQARPANGTHLVTLAIADNE
jgi:hypothetical protein